MGRFILLALMLVFVSFGIGHTLATDISSAPIHLDPPQPINDTPVLLKIFFWPLSGHGDYVEVTMQGRCSVHWPDGPDGKAKTEYKVDDCTQRQDGGAEEELVARGQLITSFGRELTVDGKEPVKEVMRPLRLLQDTESSNLDKDFQTNQPRAVGTDWPVNSQQLSDDSEDPDSSSTVAPENVKGTVSFVKNEQIGAHQFSALRVRYVLQKLRGRVGRFAQGSLQSGGVSQSDFFEVPDDPNTPTRAMYFDSVEELQFSKGEPERFREYVVKVLYTSASERDALLKSGAAAGWPNEWLATKDDIVGKATRRHGEGDQATVESLVLSPDGTFQRDWPSRQAGTWTLNQNELRLGQAPGSLQVLFWDRTGFLVREVVPGDPGLGWSEYAWYHRAVATTQK